ncbi:MAG: hypothetical protein HYV42_04145, partial [Candidatus Magasanikbacteria bacterium]|nr:hypothetical protein [Candidatus Magasanikbacteria bacterium]
MARLKISLVVLLAAAVSIIVLAQTNAQTSTTTVADTTPPVISAVSGTTNIGVTMVTWTTDEPSDSVVEHGSGPSYGSVISNSFLVTNHSVQLNVGFGYDYTYYFRVKSKDASGNVAVSGQQTIFVPLPNVACTDSDNGLTYNQKGTGTGIYAGAVVGYHKIYGQEPHPATPKDTTDQFSTYIDHCATATQLNEGFCSGGKLSAFGYQCPYGCTNGACNAAPAKVACTDSDNGQNLNTKGVAKGFFAGGPVSYSAIYGLEPNPDSAKTTADNFSTYYDYCVNSIQLNESFCDSNGNLAALSFPCSYGCNASAGVCNSPPNDAPPVITAAVKSANTLHPTTIYAGLRAYISITVTDDKGIAFANFNAPGMRYSSADVTLYQCANVKSCSEPVYIIIPDKAGNYTVTVTAKDSAGQTDIKTVAFTAQGCATNSECGGTYFNTGTATTCGPYGASLYTQRMQGQTVAVCSVGTCSEKIQDGVLEDCGVNNKVCGFSPQNGGQFQCVAKPAADCSAGSPITSSCQCGLSSYESYGYCCKDSAGKLYHSTSACPTVSSASVVPGAGAPEPATNEAGVWAQVDVGNGQIAGAAICTRAVCGLNGEYHGYVPPSSWISGSVWWPTAKRYIWQLPGQAGYNSGTFNFNTYVFTVPGGTIYNGQFTATIATSTASSPVVYPAASSVTTPAAPSPAPTVAEPAANPVVFPTTTLPAAVAFPTTTVATTTVPAAPAFVAPSLAVTPPAEAPPAPSEQFFSTRREILRDLRAVERSVKRGEAELDQKQLRTIKAKLLTLPPGTA